MQDVRRSEIAELIKEKGKLRVSELTSAFKVSEITIHRDLDYLEDTGVLRRTRGGAIANTTTQEFQYPNRVNSCLKEKNVIADAVVKLIKEGDSIILDGSTTNIHVAKRLKDFSNLTVFTTSPLVLFELINSPGIFLYCIGGLYSREMAHFIGSELEEYITRLHLSKCVIGASAISPEYGVTGPYPQLVSIQKKIIKSSKEIILAADHTKYGKVATEKVASIEEIDHFVVDSGLDPKYAQAMKEKTDLIIAK